MVNRARAGASGSATQNMAALQPLEDGKRIRVCSIAVSSGSALLGNLKWSELGQALVVTDDSLVILSPLAGLHPSLAAQSRIQDVECHPDWDGRFPHSVIQISVKTFLENESSIRRRILLEADHSTVDPRFLGVQWCSASWSKPGMGPHGSCLILATTSELDLFVLGAPSNAWTGEWKLLHAMDLKPVADLTELNATPSGQFDADAFSQSRALMRKKQLATEVLCAAIIDVKEPSSTRMGLSSGSTSSQPTSTYVIAGTRSGHIVVWECQAVTGHCTFRSATPVSRTGVEQLTPTAHIAAKTIDAQARIAFQDADGVRFCDFYAQQERASIQLSTLPPVRSGHCMISTWYWCEHQLIYSTIGQVHVYDVRDGNNTVFTLGTGSNRNNDPYSPAISITASPEPEDRPNVILQDLREYHIPSVEGSQSHSLPAVLQPKEPLALSGYPPLIVTLQRKHDHHQVFLGCQHHPDSKLSSAHLIGAVRTDERVAFLGYNVSETLRYQLELVCGDDVAPAAVLDEALAKVSSTQPYLLLRTILALLYTSSRPDDFLHQLLAAAEERWRSVLAQPSREADQTSQKRLLYLLARRLETSSSPDQPSELDVLSKQHKASILSDWLKRWIPDLTERISGDGTPEHDRRLLLRLSTASHMIPNAETQLLDACRAAISALGAEPEAQEPGSSTLTDETCAACETRLSISWDDTQQDFGWAKCQTGHMWRKYSKKSQIDRNGRLTNTAASFHHLCSLRQRDARSA